MKKPAEKIRRENNCRNTYGVPLFWVMRNVTRCTGSKIEHLLAAGTFRLTATKAEIFIVVLRRLCQGKVIPADDFAVLCRKLHCRYAPADRYLTRRGFGFANFSDALIGDVRSQGDHFIYTQDFEIASARDTEFKKPKYKKLHVAQLGMLKTMFELTELTKKLQRKPL